MRTDAEQTVLEIMVSPPREKTLNSEQVYSRIGLCDLSFVVAKFVFFIRTLGIYVFFYVTTVLVEVFLYHFFSPHKYEEDKMCTIFVGHCDFLKYMELTHKKSGPA